MLVTFDTQEYVNNLKKGGFSDEQANSMAKAQKIAINEAMDSTLATKTDTNQIDKKVDEVKAELVLVKWMLGVVIAVEVLPLLKQLL
ncbi:MAG: DUF1640 domain-containing protein [Candidatus Neomarinimicrobiota bacterium]|nr:MAG: DUF1640 domain-containing protein [Candidatus Neomarinimicrobiota bacterium]